MIYLNALTQNIKHTPLLLHDVFVLIKDHVKVGGCIRQTQQSCTFSMVLLAHYYGE